MVKSILICVEIFMFIFFTYLFENVGIAFVLFLIGAILTYQWLIYGREYNEAQELCGKILEGKYLVNENSKTNDNNINNADFKKIIKKSKIKLDELEYDIELFKKTADYLINTTKIRKEDFAAAARMNALQCENIKIKIDKIKEINSSTINLIAVAFSVMALLVSLGDAAATVFPPSLIDIICGASLLFILIHIEQYILTEKRLSTKLFQYNYKQMEQIWLEQKLTDENSNTSDNKINELVNKAVELGCEN
ncbi:hypothetical protein [Acetobacterium wieringae]|uniref:hypothetical protein n=1 Tax=Acetobacterium wieringae TaxID=52694 RepID=UPI003159549F